MSVLTSIQDQLRHVDELIAHFEHTAIETPRPSIAANIRALEKERRNLQSDFDRAALESEIDVYRYRILDRDRVTLTGLTDAWREFQNLLAVVYESIRHGAPKKKSKGKTVAGTWAEPVELGFGYSFPGSIGVALTLPNRAGLFADEAIIQATEAIFNLAEAYGDGDKVARIARQLGPAPVAAMYSWVDIHVGYGFGVGIEWKRTATQTRSLLVQFEQMRALRERLSVTTIETRTQVTGTLAAVDSDEATFRIHQDDGVDIEGTYRDAISREQAARVPARYNATIIKRTKVVQSETAPQPDTFFLESLTEID